MIAIDKKYHAIAGFFIGSVAYVASIDYGASVLLGIVVAGFTAGLIGVLKELHDKYYKRSQFDWEDVLATIAGSPIGALLGILIVKILG